MTTKTLRAPTLKPNFAIAKGIFRTRAKCDLREAAAAVLGVHVVAEEAADSAEVAVEVADSEEVAVDSAAAVAVVVFATRDLRNKLLVCALFLV